MMGEAVYTISNHERTKHLKKTMNAIVSLIPMQDLQAAVTA